MGSFYAPGGRHDLNVMLLTVPEIDVTSRCVGGSRNGKLCSLFCQHFRKGNLGFARIDRTVVMAAHDLNESVHIIERGQIVKSLNRLLTDLTMLPV